MSRYRCVDAQKAAGFPIAAACQAAGVTRSAWYAWSTSAARGPSEHDQEQAKLVREIRRIHARSSGTYGAPRMTAELRRRGWRANHKRVERLMRAHGIVGHRPRRRRRLTRPDAGAAPAPDLLGRLFDPDRPDVAWCGDVTWIPTEEGWLYLASVIDLASRHLVGWSMSAHHDAALVVSALDAAAATRGRRRMSDTIFHSDRGAEGGFNWLSQHLEMEVVRDGCGQATAEDQGDAWPDVVAGSAVDRAARGSSPLLGGDRSRPIERGRRGAGRRVAGGRLEMVPAGWWDATDLLGPSVGPIPVVLRTRRDRDPARPAARGPWDRSPHRSFTIDDFAGASPQRLDSQSLGDLSGDDRAVARRTARQPPQGGQARRGRWAAGVRAGPPGRHDRQTRRRAGARARCGVHRPTPRPPSGSALGQVLEPRADLQPPPGRFPR